MTIKGRVSVIIPSRNEKFLTKTIKDVLAKSRGDLEVIAVLDGYWQAPEEIVSDRRLHYLHNGQSLGMRSAINRGAAIATGEYLLKSDGHCMYDEGFDVRLVSDVPVYTSKLQGTTMPDNWIVIPRRNRLDAEKWEIQEVGKPPVDYEYISSPTDKGVKGIVWAERYAERKQYQIDENLSFQGSCWFMTRRHYFEDLGGMSNEGYGTFVREAQEIGLKTWLTGGKVYTNKNTWYAHLHKGKTYGRGYFLNKKEMDAGNAYCDDFWFNNRLPNAKHDLAWLIEQFMPVPGWTPELIEQVRKK